MNRIEWSRLAAIAMLSVPLLIGCSGGQEDSQQSAMNTGTDAATSGAAAAGGEPAPASIVENGVDSDASQCVAIFLDSLRRGDERAANGVLTTKAREELAKTAYVIQPLGTPDGEYRIGRVGFPYEEKNVALVECTWIEPPVPGEERLAMEIVCEVHQETEGWRISGMGVSIPGTDEALVLDFEDAAALQATIDAATAPSPNDGPPPTPQSQQVVQQQMPQQQMAQQQMAQQQMPQQTMPNLPTYPAQQQINVDNSAPPQLAYPPAYESPVKR